MFEYVVIGSRAASEQGILLGRKESDIDVVCSFKAFQNFYKSIKEDTDNTIKECFPTNGGKKYILKYSAYGNLNIYEFELTWEGSTAEMLFNLVKKSDEKITNDYDMERWHFAGIHMLYTLKMAHRYKKNSPHFLKTMDDIHLLRKEGASIPEEYMEFFKARETESYNYGHPKLNTTKKEFFNTPGIVYQVVHDDIHEAVKHLDRPAYEYYKPDTAEVFCSKEMFYACSEEIRLFGVLEEAYTLAIERAVFPLGTDPKVAFDIALEKICTSITSGFFREYSWEHYHLVKAMYDPRYVEKFQQALDAGKVRKVEFK